MSLNSGKYIVFQVAAIAVLTSVMWGLWGREELLGGGKGLERVDRRGRVDCFRAIRGGSLLDFCDGDGGHGLLGASIVSYSLFEMTYSIQVFVIITYSHLPLRFFKKANRPV